MTKEEARFWWMMGFWTSTPDFNAVEPFACRYTTDFVDHVKALYKEFEDDWAYRDTVDLEAFQQFLGAAASVLVKGT